jgi:hypothetical protein
MSNTVARPIYGTAESLTGHVVEGRRWVRLTARTGKGRGCVRGSLLDTFDSEVATAGAWIHRFDRVPTAVGPGLTVDGDGGADRRPVEQRCDHVKGEVDTSMGALGRVERTAKGECLP